MRARTRNVYAYALAVLTGALLSAGYLHAQISVGTWIRQQGPSTPGELRMTVEPCCNGGRRLTYRLNIGNGVPVMVVESPFDGTEVPVMVGGKPSGETMAIKSVDSRHWTCVLKIDGKPFGTSKGELSIDGKTITVENNISFAAGGQEAGIQKEVWIKK